MKKPTNKVEAALDVILDPFRLSNWIIRTACKIAAALFALTARLLAAIGLRIVRAISRRRVDW